MSDGYYEKDGKKYDKDTDERIIKQGGKTYRENFFGNWKADKDWLGDDKVERDWLGTPVVERDWLGNEVIERDWLGNLIVDPRKQES